MSSSNIRSKKIDFKGEALEQSEGDATLSSSHLGVQAAYIVDAVDKWFQLTNGKLDKIAERLENKLNEPANPGGESVSPVTIEQISINNAISERNETIFHEAAIPVFPSKQSSNADVEVAGLELANFEPVDSRNGWIASDAAELLNGGVIELYQNKDSVAVQSPIVRLPQGGLIRISAEAATSLGPTTRIALRLVDEIDNCLGCDLELQEGLSQSYWFISRRKTSVRVKIIVQNSGSVGRLTLRRLTIERICIDELYRAQKGSFLASSIASLASIPERREMLRDCIESLLVQCDLVRVFLNGYPDIPDFLDHPRIEVRRSQMWDDNGDAGKFGWLEAGDDPGYRIIADDDLIYPTDFVKRMTSCVNSYNNRAIVGLHGILLKQPLVNYYEPKSRVAFHFQSALQHDRACHVLGSNALCFFSSSVVMSRADFQYRNMADIFLARYAKDRSLPMISIARPQNWVRQNVVEGAIGSIYDSSLKQDRSPFDSSIVQNAIVRRLCPLSIKQSKRPKIVLVILATEVKAFAASIEAYRAFRSIDYEWAIIVAPFCGTDDVREAIRIVDLLDEVHVVDQSDLTAGHPVMRAVDLARDIGFDFMLVITDHVRLQSGDWLNQVISTLGSRDRGFLVIYDPDASSLYLPTEINGAFFASFTFKAVCDVDVSNIAERGQPGKQLATWLIEVNAVALRVPVDDELERVLRVGVEISEGGRIWDQEYGNVTDSAVPYIREKWRSSPPLTFNRFFDRIYVINLDRRPERLKDLEHRLEKVGIRADKISACDGDDILFAQEYKEYSSQPIVENLSDVRSIRSLGQFYRDYDSAMARVSFIERRLRSKAIQSTGAWAYLRTWERLLERVLSEGTNSVLVLNDDVMFHANAQSIFAAAVVDLPANWRVLQLGTLQYEWGSEWVNWKTRMLYSTGGSSVGSHAVGFNLDVAPFLLEHVRRRLLPFDVGALSMSTRAFRDQCFVVYPNIAVPNFDVPGDIDNLQLRKAVKMEKAADLFRWCLADYVF